MTTEKLVSKFQRFMGLKESKQKEKRDKIGKLLKKLKARHSDLKDSLEKEKDKNKRKRLKREIKVVCEQRRKGIKLCKELRHGK